MPIASDTRFCFQELFNALHALKSEFKKYRRWKVISSCCTAKMLSSNHAHKLITKLCVVPTPIIQHKNHRYNYRSHSPVT